MDIIYMPLLNEGTDVWRPVSATPIAGGSFRVEGPVPEGETWAFAPGAIVRCAPRTFDGGERRVAAVEILG